MTGGLARAGAAVLLLWAGLLAGAASAQDAAAIARGHLERGTLAAGDRELAALPGDGQAVELSLGTIRFVRAVERLAQGLYRHGLRAPRNSFIPILRLPVPPNPRPEPLTYGGFRAILTGFASDLAGAEETLARAGPGSRLHLDLAAVRLDIDGDGRAGESERLWTILAGIDPRASRSGGSGAATFPVTFDEGDILWARGYAHLLAGIVEFWLAHDFSAQFDQTFQLFFPAAGLPFPAPAGTAEYSGMADLLAFAHLLNWPVAEPARLAASLAHFEAVPAMSRRSWAAIRAERDDESEWIPHPGQTNRFPSLPVTEERIDAWLAAMDGLAAVLDGRKLVPHWRFEKGVNLRRAFLEHRVFDPVLWLTGSGVTPFLETGATVTAGEWRDMVAAFGGNFFGYAAWFN